METNANPQGTYPQGAVTRQDITEGRFVVLTAGVTAMFGSQADLPGVKLPETDAVALTAHHIVTFTAPDRVVGPNNLLFVPQPSYEYALREGYDKAANLPMTNTTVRTVWPGNQESQVIASGTKCLIYGAGSVVTVPSGQYVWNAALQTPGARLEVLNTTDDTLANSGKLSYAAAGTIAEVVDFDSTDASLMVRIL